MKHLLDPNMVNVPIRRPPQSADSRTLITPSRLNLWLRCPLAHKLTYIDRVRTPTSESQFLGQRVHAALAAFYRGRMLGMRLAVADCLATMHRDWDVAVAEQQTRFTCSAQERQLKQQAAGLVRAYLSQSPDEDAEFVAVDSRLEATPVDPVTGEQLPIPLAGTIDLILDTGSGPVIIDFRTSSRSTTPLPQAHEIALAIHAYLVRDHFGFKESDLQLRILIRTKVPKIETHTFPQRDHGDFGRLFAVIREYLEAMDRGVFQYRPAWTCGMCDFVTSHCHAWYR